MSSARVHILDIIPSPFFILVYQTNVLHATGKSCESRMKCEINGKDKNRDLA